MIVTYGLEDCAVRVDEDGDIYITDNSPGSSGYWIKSHELLTALEAVHLALTLQRIKSEKRARRAPAKRRRK